MEKKCFKCGAVKPINEFYVHRGMAGGTLNKCKECTINDVNKHRKNNIESVKEYDRNRGRTEDRKSKNIEYAIRNKSKMTIIKKEWRKRNREKTAAHQVVNRAVFAGKLIRPENCQKCGKKVHTEAHHDDYSKQLEVRWLCDRCHKDHHLMEREMLRKGMAIS